MAVCCESRSACGQSRFNPKAGARATVGVLLWYAIVLPSFMAWYFTTWSRLFLRTREGDLIVIDAVLLYCQPSVCTSGSRMRCCVCVVLSATIIISWDITRASYHVVCVRWLTTTEYFFCCRLACSVLDSTGPGRCSNTWLKKLNYILLQCCIEAVYVRMYAISKNNTIYEVFCRQFGTMLLSGHPEKKKMIDTPFFQIRPSWGGCTHVMHDDRSP